MMSQNIALITKLPDWQTTEREGLRRVWQPWPGLAWSRLITSVSSRLIWAGPRMRRPWLGWEGSRGECEKLGSVRNAMSGRGHSEQCFKVAAME